MKKILIPIVFLISLSAFAQTDDTQKEISGYTAVIEMKDAPAEVKNLARAGRDEILASAQ